MLKVLVAAAIFGSALAATPAGASHDTIYSPCSTEYGFIHMTYEEWDAHITTMEADGTIPPGVVFRYNEALHGGKGLEDPRIVWARGLTDGQILSLDDWLNGDYPEIEALNFSAGLVPEWILDANMTIRRVDDPYWAQANPMTPTFTVWQSLCMGNYGYSIPAMEINEAGVWESNIPSTTTIAIVPTTTQPPVVTTTTMPSVTTTLDSSVMEDPEITTSEDQGVPSPPPPTVSPDSLSQLDDYDLFDAEWDGYPFMETILLLEERYPPGTPDKFHFRLSVAVEFLRNGGMVKGLDNLWDSGS
jgi:hypothetical protein